MLVDLSVLITFLVGFAFGYPVQKSVCDGKQRYEQCLPVPQTHDDTNKKPTVLDMIFPFAMQVTPGTWEEGGTIYATMCMFQQQSPETCFTVTTDQHDANLMHRQAGYRDVLWENALLVPCHIPERKDTIWYLRVTDHANYGLNQHWVNTTNIFGPFVAIPAPCGLFSNDQITFTVGS